ncbi:MAG: DNA polymerase III subunit gamma/tau [Elusimicrobia bacterium]|nr:DNA polymerase III subunit gamma/tau [Elusimicrobiota bacterium]
MSYVVLARKYRPQKFEDIVGQEHVCRVLKNAIKEERIAHGYIFSGQRGVGKTTTARIFAKALNCKDGPKEEPCDKCDSCRGILKGTSLDLLELDAASNRGIDEIRDLRENVKYAPSVSKYKIYIIDEVHMLTNEAFNALLKTLEEPPSHVIFIFATTSTQKIPATILSRCQRFNFKPLSIKEISEQLIKIAEKEDVKIDEKAVALIARSAGGALRDALSVFDQVISFCGSKIGAQDVISILGIVKEDILSRMVGYILANDTKNLLHAVNETIVSGYDPLNIVSDLQEYLRNIMLYKVSPELVVTVSDTEKLKTYSGEFSIDVLLRFSGILSECIRQMKNAEQPILVLEVTCVKLAQKYVGLDELVSRLESLESSSYPEDNAVSRSSSAVPVSNPSKPQPASVPSSKVPLDRAQQAWNELSKEKIRPRIVAGILGGRISSQSDGVFTIEFNNSINMDLINSSRDLWLPLIEKKIGGRFEFVTKIKTDSGADDAELEEADPSVEGEEPSVINGGDITADDSRPEKESESSEPPVKKKTRKKVFEKEPAVKLITDLFGGEVTEE